MKASDTVMNEGQLNEQLNELEERWVKSIAKTYCEDINKVLNLNEQIAKAQAEITWEIAFKAGIKETVEQVSQLVDCGRELVEVIDDKYYSIDSFTTQPLRDALCEWEAKLREWRLNDGS